MADFGMNLRVTMDSKQGGRKYMEDVLAVEFKKTEDGRNIEYTFLAVFDGHGGSEAAKFAKEHLLQEVTKHKGFWSNDDSEVERAIRDGFLSTQKLMWKAVATWPKTLSGYPSTAGTTASVCFIRNGKMYIAHVGDSTVVMGLREDETSDVQAWSVTKDHKPECPQELKRIQGCGGNVVPKAGVPRVVWNRPKLHQGCVRRSTNVDSIPFLAIARALGDLWSYNAANDKFVVSPDPDICTTTVDLSKQKFIILASDGLWNMVSFQEAVDVVSDLDPEARHPVHGRKPASHLVQMALDRWSKRMLRADNTSVIVAYFDPPGMPPKDLLLRTPSDVSTSSTLKTADSDDNPSDEEFELFPSEDIDLTEDSHQLANGAILPPTKPVTPQGDKKPTLKRIPGSVGSGSLLQKNTLKKNGFSTLLNQKEKVNGAHSKGDQDSNIIYEANSDYDPSKASIISVRYSSPNQAQKRPSSNKDSCSVPAKRARLATPESSQVANSPKPGTNGARTRRLSGPSSSSCAPLKLDVPEAALVPASSVSSEPMISPLWPSHLADDLDNSDSVTSIKPRLNKGESIPRDVLQENLSSKSSTPTLPSMQSKASPSSASKSTQGSQNRSPMTRACVKRLSGSPRYSIRRQSRLSPHTSKKLRTVHRTRVTRKSATPKRS